MRKSNLVGQCGRRVIRIHVLCPPAAWSTRCGTKPRWLCTGQSFGQLSWGCWPRHCCSYMSSHACGVLRGSWGSGRDSNHSLPPGASDDWHHFCSQANRAAQTLLLGPSCLWMFFRDGWLKKQGQGVYSNSLVSLAGHSSFTAYITEAIGLMLSVNLRQGWWVSSEPVWALRLSRLCANWAAESPERKDGRERTSRRAMKIN